MYNSCRKSQLRDLMFSSVIELQQVHRVENDIGYLYGGNPDTSIKNLHFRYHIDLVFEDRTL